MKIGFYLEWMVGSLLPSNKWNVVGEELLAMGWIKELKKIDSSIEADLYSHNKKPTEKLDIMIYMNYNSKINYDWADKNIMYIENDFGDKGSASTIIKKYLSKYKIDAILSFSERIIDFLEKSGYKTYYFPFSVDTEIYHPVKYDSEFDYEIAYVGSNIKGGDNNKKFMKPVLKYNTGLFGNWKTILGEHTRIRNIWKTEKKPDIYTIAIIIKLLRLKIKDRLNRKLFRLSQGKISTENMIKLLSSSKIMLNVTLPGNKHFDMINYRILEALACKGFVISDYTPLAEKYLSGCLVFSKGGKDLREKIDYYLEHEDERKAIAQRGYEEIQKHYTSKQRAQELYDIIKEVL